MSNDKSTDIFFVEDNEVLRYCLRTFLKGIADFNLVGEAASGKEAIKAISTLKPAVALVDIGLPDIDGISVTRRIKSEQPNLRILMLTASDNERDIFDSLDAGADGYVLKEDYANNLEIAIRSVRIGAVWLDPGIAKLVLRVTNATAKSVQGRFETQPREALSFEEQKVLGQVAASDCQDGHCLVEPEFLSKLRRFSKQGKDQGILQ